MQTTEDLKKDLKSLGYSDYYSRVILTLISENEKLTAKDIEDKSGVPRERLYSILISLEKDGIINTIPGAVRKYSSVPKDRLIESLKNKNKKELEEKKQSFDISIESITEKLKDYSQNDEYTLSIYTSDERYWLIYAESVARLMPGDRYRIINSLRLCESYSEYELENNPALNYMIENDREKIRHGAIIHYITNPKSLVENIMCEYGDKTILKNLMQKLLKNFRNPHIMYNQRITIHPEFKNLVFIILKDDVFIELYGKSSSSISSVIHIRSKKIAEDFASWFDSLDKNTTHDPEKDYNQFEKEIKTQCKKIAGIEL